MATLISQIIADAYREANLIAVETSPTANQQTEGLRLFNRFLRSLFGNEMGDPLEPVPYGNNNVDTATLRTSYYEGVLNYYIPMNSRLLANLSSAKTLNLYPKPVDGARLAVVDASSNFATYNLTLNGNGRKIDGALSVTLSTDDQDTEWFYRADIGEWKQITDLVTSDASPFPIEFDEFLIIGLAMRLASRYGVAMADTSVMLYRRGLSQFRARYQQNEQQSSELGLIRTPGTHHDVWDSSWNLGNAFERGYPFG